MLAYYALQADVYQALFVETSMCSFSGVIAAYHGVFLCHGWLQRVQAVYSSRFAISLHTHLFRLLYMIFYIKYLEIDPKLRAIACHLQE